MKMSIIYHEINIAVKFNVYIIFSAFSHIEFQRIALLASGNYNCFHPSLSFISAFLFSLFPLAPFFCCHFLYLFIVSSLSQEATGCDTLNKANHGKLTHVILSPKLFLFRENPFRIFRPPSSLLVTTTMRVSSRAIFCRTELFYSAVRVKVKMTIITYID